MKKMICAMLAALMAMIGAWAMAEAAALPAALQAEITVQGSGTISTQPDMVTATVNAAVTAPTILEAQTQVSDIVARTTAGLLELGVLGDDIVTASYDYHPVYIFENDVRVLNGYQASHTMEITCRDIQMLDSVISVTTDCGMTDIYSIRYDVSNRGALYLQALELAIRSAEEKALIMAATGGKTITGLSSLTENQSYDARYAYKNVAITEDSAAGTGIRAGSVSVSASVTAVYHAQ